MTYVNLKGIITKKKEGKGKSKGLRRKVVRLYVVSEFYFDCPTYPSSHKYLVTTMEG